MSIEIGNVIHAMASVGVGAFRGQGNVGFAPFGVGANFSQVVATGRVRLRLLEPINLLPNGEGIVIPTIFPSTGGFPLLTNATIVAGTDSPPDPNVILVHIQQGGMDANVPFDILVLRFPQQSTQAG
jgi:hypothetical protein